MIYSLLGSVSSSENYWWGGGGGGGGAPHHLQKCVCATVYNLILFRTVALRAI